MGSSQAARYSQDKKVSLWQLRYAAGRWSNSCISCKRAKILVAFTPKAGCSFASKIFFHNTGGHDTADFLDWPHPYRISYQKSHRTTLKDWLRADMDTLKFVRNPFSRAVSSYLQAMRTGLGDVIGQPVTAKSMDWSFKQYLAWLETTRLDLTEPHFGPQKFWGEGKVFRFKNVIKIEEVADTIVLASGKELEVPPSFRSSAHHVRRGKTAGYFGDTPYSQLATDTSIFPDWQYFYDDRTTEVVVKLYRRDFLAYDYPLCHTA